MDDLIIFTTAVGLLAAANVWGDHSWAPSLEAPFNIVPVVYMFSVGGQLYLEHGMTGVALAVLLWIESPIGQAPVSVSAMAGSMHSMHSTLLRIGVFLVVVQAAYLFISIKIWRAKRQAR